MKREAKKALRLPPKVWSALEYAICIANLWIEDAKVQIDLLEEEVFTLQEKFIPIFEQRGWQVSPELLGFDVLEEDCDTILKQFRDSPKLAKVIAESLALNVFRGYPVPKGLRPLAYYILSGQGTLTRPKPVKPTLAHRDFLLVALAKRVKRDTGIPLGASEAALLRGKSIPICGATIAAAAFHAFGVQINAPQAAKIVYEKGKIAEDSRISERVVNMNFGTPGVNALAGLPPAFSLRKADISLLQNEFERALIWLETPL